MAVGILNIGINASTAGLAKGLATAQGQLARFGAGLGTVRTALVGFGAALGAKALASEFIGTAVEVEQRVVGLAKATDLSGVGLAGMKAALVDLSTTMAGVSAEELFAIATTGAKLGKSGAELLAYTEDVARVSAAIDDIPATQLADELGKIDVVFKLGSRGAIQLGSAIDKVADSGASAASGILEVVQRIGGTAVASKVTAQESIALAGALLDTGTNSELAATSITRLMMAFAAEAEPIKAVHAFLARLRTEDAATQLQSIGALGIDAKVARAEIQKLAQNFDSVTKYTSLANEQFITLDQSTTSYNKSAATTGAQWEQFKNKVEAISDTIGGLLLPAINSALEGFGGLGAGGSSAAVSITSAMNEVSSAIGFVADVVAFLKRGFLGVQVAFTSTVAAILKAASALDEINIAIAKLRGIEVSTPIKDQADAMAKLAKEQFDAFKAAADAPLPSVAIKKNLADAANNARLAATEAERLKAAAQAGGPAAAAGADPAAIARARRDPRAVREEARAARRSARAAAEAAKPPLAEAVAGAITGAAKKVGAAGGFALAAVTGAVPAAATAAERSAEGRKAAEGPQFAAALELGSREARSAVLAAMGAAEGGNKGLLDTSKKQLHTQMNMERALQKIAAGGFDASAGLEVISIL